MVKCSIFCQCSKAIKLLDRRRFVARVKNIFIDISKIIDYVCDNEPDIWQYSWVFVYCKVYLKFSHQELWGVLIICWDKFHGKNQSDTVFPPGQAGS